MDQRVMQLRAAEWKKLLSAQMESGLGKDEWCRQNGISRWKFYRWQKIIRDMALTDTMPANAESGTAFAELALPSPKKMPDAARQTPAPQSEICSRYSDICISYGGFTIHVPSDGVSTSALTSVLKAVRSAH